jgi:hypothetical protein
MMTAPVSQDKGLAGGVRTIMQSGERRYRRRNRLGQGSLQDVKTPAVFGGW